MSSSLPPGMQAQVNKLQQLQNELQVMILRKQQLELQLRETETALEELGKINERDKAKIYKLAGPILVSTTYEKIKNELEEDKETLEIKIKTIEKQEGLLRKQVTDLQKRLSKELSSFRGISSSQ